MGEPTQEILKTPDLDTEASFIALQHQTNCCCNAFACLLATGRKALPQMEADQNKATLIGQLANARTLDMYHTIERREHCS